jgi:hypothetical protein
MTSHSPPNCGYSFLSVLKLCGSEVRIRSKLQPEIVATFSSARSA